METRECRDCKREVEVFHDDEFVVCSECGRTLAEDFDYVPPPLAAPGKPILFAMADCLKVPSAIKDGAYAVYGDAVDMTAISECDPNAVKAACLYLACKKAEEPRTFKELERVARGATANEIERATDVITDGLNAPPPFWPPGIPAHLVIPVCSELGMSSSAVDATFEVLDKWDKWKTDGGTSAEIAAAIYLVSLLSEDAEKKSLGDVSRATEVAEELVSERFDELRPQAAHVVPEWYCKPEDVKLRCHFSIDACAAAAAAGGM